MNTHNRWSEPAVAEVEWRDKYAPAYVDHALVEQAMQMPPNDKGDRGMALLACAPEECSEVHPGPPYRYWVVRAILVDLRESHKRGTICCTVLTSHGMAKEDDTAESVQLEFLTQVGLFIAKTMKEDTDAAA